MALMKAWLSSIAPTLGPLGRWLRRVFKLDRRWGVRYYGGLERVGFRTDRHAEAWARDMGFAGWVVFHYDPIDLRLPGISHPQRSEWHP